MLQHVSKEDTVGSENQAVNIVLLGLALVVANHEHKVRELSSVEEVRKASFCKVSHPKETPPRASREKSLHNGGGIIARRAHQRFQSRLRLESYVCCCCGQFG